jgi:hypothetical protein
MRKEAVFSIQELRHVSITCPHCGTKVILDMARYEPRASRDYVGFAPRSCPALSCKKPYDSAIVALDTLQEVYALLAKLEGVVWFHADAEAQTEIE